LKRRGTFRPDRRHNEPQAPDVDVRKPMWVKGLAAKHWKAIAPWLDAAGLLTVLDAVALGLLCDSLAEYFEAGEVVDAATKTEGGVKFISHTDKGNIIQHPAVGVRNKAWERTVKLLREFGMTPSSRANISIANTTGERADPLLEMLHKRMGQN
jgi:P27 family predicted phage terminase small subunit